MNPCSVVRNQDGLYEINGCLPVDEIARMAATLLYENLRQKERLSNPSDAARYLQLHLATEANEHFSVLFLDHKHGVICAETLFTGTVNSATVHPRVVVQEALRHNAAAVILAHNHPSDDSEPSVADKQITQTLTEALALIDVRVLDHFVVSRSGWVSLAERGWL